MRRLLAVAASAGALQRSSQSIRLPTRRHSSVRNALQSAVERLRAASVAEPEASAEWLLAHVLGATSRSAVAQAVAARDDLDPAAAARFDAMVARRLRREPTQYIVGRWAFHDVELEVAPPVLIPRPETEELVDLVLDWWPGGPARFADVGSGSGALGLALLNALPPGSSCVAVDVEPAAVALSRRNAASLGFDAAQYRVDEGGAADLEGAAGADFAEALDAEAAATGDAGAQAAAASLEEVLDVDAAPYAPPTPSPTAEGEKKKTKRRILGLPGQLALVLFAAAVALISICGCWYACAGSGDEPERTSSPDVELNDVCKQPKKTTREVV